MSLRSSYALVGSWALLFAACGGGSEIVGGAGAGGSGASSSGGHAGSNLAGETGAGGSDSSSGGKDSVARTCTPHETGVCIGPGACIGGRECRPDGMSWSKCDCGNGTGGVASSGGTSSGGTKGDGGDVSTGGSASGGSASGGAGAGGASSGGAATGGSATGGSASGGSASGGMPATGGSSTGGAATGGAGTGGDGGGAISVGGSTCVGRPTHQEWTTSNTQATGDQVRYKCTAPQAGCAGLPTGVDHLFECNQEHLLNCENQTPETGNSWTFVLDCAPHRDSLVDCSRAESFTFGASTNFVTSISTSGSLCVGASLGLRYMFECVDPYRPNCGEVNPGATNWGNPPWQRVGRCE